MVYWNRRAAANAPGPGQIGMKIAYTGRSAHLSPKERGKIQRRLDKIERILARRANLEAHAILSRERHLHSAEVTLRAMRHTLVVAGSGVTQFSAMQAALEKLERQALRNKRRIIDSHRPGRQRGEPSALAVGTAKDLTAAQASRELEQSGQDSISFRDAETGGLYVLARRDDHPPESAEGS